MDTTERLAKVEARVESLKEDVAELKSDVREIHSRITIGNREIIEKIDGMETKIEERMQAGAEASARQHQDIELNMRADIQQITSRVDILERWRWMIVGGAIAIGYIASHLEIFSKIFGK